MLAPHIFGSKPDCCCIISSIPKQSVCLCLSSIALTKFETLCIVSVVFCLAFAIILHSIIIILNAVPNVEVRDTTTDATKNKSSSKKNLSQFKFDFVAGEFFALNKV